MTNCPYCDTKNNNTNIIDTGHLHLNAMGKKHNTRNVYLCRECGECYEAYQGRKRFEMSVDRFFDREFQYCRGNLARGFDLQAGFR